MRRDFKVADSHDMLEQAVSLLRECACRAIPVEHDGRLVGMLTMDNVGEFIMIQSALRQARRLDHPAGSLTASTSGRGDS
jgi:predicted transcriptional regulator